MNRQVLRFQQPGAVAIETEPIPAPGPGELLVQTRLSAVSGGTERLFYQGRIPADTPLDTAIPALSGTAGFPFKYGYAAAGRVLAAGSRMESDWVGRRVFAFNPHESHFTASPEALFELPDAVAWRDAVFLPNMETAVNFLMDGGPVVGETAAVFGMGIVGLLTTELLARFPLAAVVAVDPCPARRALAAAMGERVHAAAPGDAGALISELTGGIGPDLVYEVSGNPAALDQAVAVAGFDTRIIVGSWYGGKRCDLDLGGRFHRNRVCIASSQVSTLSPLFRGRWTHHRRLATAMAMIREIEPSRFISHEFDFLRAPEAYALLDRPSGEALQIVFRYSN